MSKKRFGIGLIVGAVAGLVTCLLTAPKSGKETREDIKQKADEAKKEVGKRAEQVKAKAGEVADQAKATAGHVKEVADSAVEGVKSGFAKSGEADKKSK